MGARPPAPLYVRYVQVCKGNNFNFVPSSLKHAMPSAPTSVFERMYTGQPEPLAQVLHLNNLTTEDQHVTRRTWVRVPMTTEDLHRLNGQGR